MLTDPFDPDAYPITDGEYTELLAFDEDVGFALARFVLDDVE